MALTYREGSSSKYPWGVETTIRIEDDGKPVHSVVVMRWPKDEKEQAKRGERLIANFADDLAEQAKPVPVMVDISTVEKVLVEKGLITSAQKYTDFVASTVKIAPVEEAVK